MSQGLHHGLILPGESALEQPVRQLYVPAGQGLESTVLPGKRVGLCTVCGARFYSGEEAAWERHVGACAREHIDEIHEAGQKARQVGTIFDPDQWDPEAEAALKKTGELMLKEGRMTLKPHERIGT